MCHQNLKSTVSIAFVTNIDEMIYATITPVHLYMLRDLISACMEPAEVLELLVLF